jgi:hypothetical protein
MAGRLRTPADARSTRITSGSSQLLQHPGSVNLPANDECAQRVEGPRGARTHHHTLRVDPRVSHIQFVERNRSVVVQAKDSDPG